jgi:calcineurin-like phosphoesterase family protein
MRSNDIFTADLHLGHQAILEHQPNRQFATIDEMDAYLIDQINATVGTKGILWILGDFAWKASRYGHYRQRIKCRQIHVVKGNHDCSSLRSHVSSMEDVVCRTFDDVRFHMTHYPMLSWSGKEHGTVHLYGHCHGTMERTLNEYWPNRRSMDVGVDYARLVLYEFKPFSLTDIARLLQA